MGFSDKPHAQLPRNRANHVALTPLSYLSYAARVYGAQTAVIYGTQRRSWAQTAQRCRRLASALRGAGLEDGDVVAVMATNTPELFEAHFGVPMARCVLNALNYRLDAAQIAFILEHSETRLLIADREFAQTVQGALALMRDPPQLVDIDDPAAPGAPIGPVTYEQFLAKGDPDFEPILPEDEWDAISINYTSGTTGNPKGVVYHHRGAYINATANILEWDMERHPRYLWTLPMFHCNGWCFPWTMAAKAGTSVFLRKVSAAGIYDAIADHQVTHLCGAPIVMNFIINAGPAARPFEHKVRFMTAAAPPPAPVLAAMQEAGFEVTHVYGLTEVYGPAMACAWHEAWDALPMQTQAALKSRQGVPYAMQADARVCDPETLAELPHDGVSMGEVMFRGNITMKGYLKNPSANAEAFAGGWFHTGDLGVTHPDGYIQLKDRSKDIIISGGENISSIEVEEALHAHPAVASVAVVAMPDEKWGETPCAFVELHADVDMDAEALIAWVRDHLAHYKVPRRIEFGPLPKTATGKIQKFELRNRARALA